jgi:ABC-type transporter Mla maintaining outer membrane lipid asymmetry permease subunit MlaE
MTVQTSMNFIGWLMRKWFSGVIRLNKWWTNKVQDDPWESLFIMIMFGMLIFVLTYLPAAFILYYFGIDLFAFMLIGAQIIWVGNYFRIIFVDQYRQFKEEQNRMFNEIKHSDRRYR